MTLEIVAKKYTVEEFLELDLPAYTCLFNQEASLSSR